MWHDLIQVMQVKFESLYIYFKRTESKEFLLKDKKENVFVKLK